MLVEQILFGHKQNEQNKYMFRLRNQTGSIDTETFIASGVSTLMTFGGFHSKMRYPQQTIIFKIMQKCLTRLLT